MLERFKQLIASNQYTVKESFSLPSRVASFSAIPEYLSSTGISAYLAKSLGGNARLWNHQALALRHFGDGKNVVVATGTASGKSTIFRSAAFHTVRSSASARVVVFYPLKALAADQMRGWESMAIDLGMPVGTVVRIDGSVDLQARDGLLEHGRIIVMTPDVCQAWMMARLSIPVVRNFVRDLSLIILDEAHTMEGVFGSNFAFLLRRILAARAYASGSSAEERPLRFIAATATIANPAAQLKALTGFDCEVVGEDADGSQQSERFCAHIVAPAGEEMNVARSLQVDLLKGSKLGAFITFVDSRKGVEVLARASEMSLRDELGDDSVMPYRAGYDVKDREDIERRLRSGTLRGVVSTSALELGIDLPHLTVGINVGVPSSRKAYRQRLGRVGRAGDGAFIVVAGATAFTSFGTPFREYHDLSVEESYLYLDNRFMQYAHARCIVDEVEALGAPASLPASTNWPEGFKEVFAMAKPGGSRPPEFDAIAQLAGDTPQRSYPLRNVGEVSFRITQGDGSDSFGEANQLQALRECYPGGTYLHRGRAFEVVTWNTSAFGPPFIKVKPGSPRRSTSPRITTWINAGLTSVDLLDGRYVVSEGGFLAECQMQITEKVEGYTENPPGEYRAYKDLRQKNPNLKSRQRNFRTTGVLISVKDAWFRKKGLKEFLADRLTAIFVREHSIGLQDIGCSATNISVRTLDGGGPRSDCIAIYDQTYGSLRLTERLFLQFGALLGRLRAGLEAEGATDHLDSVVSFQEWFAGLVAAQPQSHAESDEMDFSRYVRVFRPGSKVCMRDKGQMTSEVEILDVTLMENSGLMYQVKSSPRFPTSAPVKRWVPASYIEPSAESTEWEYGAWDTDTQEYAPDVDLDEESNIPP
ncbi:DEAD/DEAH box helicase [Hydrocarboniphaga effusa]|uniref:DEAD/DEAH box helicase n=1 Tax=Hydrocarboniphaga effusa TaxID=243629 RepID=UPI003BAD79A9